MKLVLPISLLGLMLFVLTACEEEPIYAPKPRAYPRVEYPERNYVRFDSSFCSFTFEYPDYMTPVQKKTFFNEKPMHPCWFDLEFEGLNGAVHITYTPIDSKEDLFEIYKDAVIFSNRHDRKASGNFNFTVNKAKENVYGILYEIDGNVASPFQFTVTDSMHHSIRAALYFNTRPEADSLRPIVEFVRQDMMHIINTIEWTEGITNKVE